MRARLEPPSAGDQRRLRPATKRSGRYVTYRLPMWRCITRPNNIAMPVEGVCVGGGAAASFAVSVKYGVETPTDTAIDPPQPCPTQEDR